jgi:hypothetical protein
VAKANTHWPSLDTVGYLLLSCGYVFACFVSCVPAKKATPKLDLTEAPLGRIHLSYSTVMIPLLMKDCVMVPSPACRHRIFKATRAQSSSETATRILFDSSIHLLSSCALSKGKI